MEHPVVKAEGNLNKLVLQFGSVERAVKIVEAILPVYRGNAPQEAVEHLFLELGLPMDTKVIS